MWSTPRFLAVRRVLGLLGLGPKPDDKDVDLAVLRHQVAILERQVSRPRYNRSDLLVLSTLLLPCPVTDGACSWSPRPHLSRWHRELVRRHWTYAHRGLHRRLPDETRRAGRAPGPGEPRPGLRTHLPGMLQTRRGSVRNVSTQHPASPSSRARPPAEWTDVGRALALPGPGCRPARWDRRGAARGAVPTAIPAQDR